MSPDFIVALKWVYFLPFAILYIFICHWRPCYFHLSHHHHSHRPITPAVFHLRLKTHLFHRTFPCRPRPPFTHSGLFSGFALVFFPVNFFWSGTRIRLNWLFVSFNHTLIKLHWFDLGKLWLPEMATPYRHTTINGLPVCRTVTHLATLSIVRHSHWRMTLTFMHTLAPFKQAANIC